MKKNTNKKGIDYWLLTLMAQGADLSDLTNCIMNGELAGELDENDAAHVEHSERVDLDCLVSSNDKQIKYITYGYVNNVYTTYQVLCTYCGTDRIAKDGTRKGDIKFKCKNEACEAKYFYLNGFVNSRPNIIRKSLAVWLCQKGFPQRYIAYICGVNPTTIFNWEIEYYDKIFSDAGVGLTGKDYLNGIVNSCHDDVKKSVAIGLTQNGFPHRYVAHIFGVHPKTIFSWEKEHDEQISRMQEPAEQMMFENHQ